MFETLRPKHRGCLFLAGDSSVDNKHWLLDLPSEDACNGFEDVLRPAASVPDVAFQVNRRLQAENVPLFCLNCAAEESTVRQRQTQLLPHDEVRGRFVHGETLPFVAHSRACA